MNEVLLGWVPSTSNKAVDGYVPYCDPPHVQALTQLQSLMYGSRLRGSSGDALWAYSPQDGGIARRNNRNLSGESMRDSFGPIGQMIANDRTELEALLARCTPEMIAEDARGVVRMNSKAIRAILSADKTDRSMVDIVATITCNSYGVCSNDDRVGGGDFVRRSVRGLSESSAMWQNGRLRISVPGIPVSNPMFVWVDKNTERVNAVRRLVADMLSD